MNFNHLMEARSNEKCTEQIIVIAIICPAGKIRTTAGENVHMTMYCKNCGRREDIFLTKEEYFHAPKSYSKGDRNV
jgi:hypothetical protein